MYGIALNEETQTRSFKREIPHISNVSIPMVGPGEIQFAESLHVPVTHDDTIRTLNILEQKGYRGKVFCKTKIPTLQSGFKVHSSKCNWNVKLATIQDMEAIPEKYYKELRNLIKNDVPIKRIALAKPEPREDPFGIINEELHQGIGTLVKGVGYFILLLVLPLKNIIMEKNGASTNRTSSYIADAPTPELLVDPDPVLLVQIQNNWIEIGRWE